MGSSLIKKSRGGLQGISTGSDKITSDDGRDYFWERVASQTEGRRRERKKISMLFVDSDATKRSGGVACFGKSLQAICAADRRGIHVTGNRLSLSRSIQNTIQLAQQSWSTVLWIVWSFGRLSQAATTLIRAGWLFADKQSPREATKKLLVGGSAPLRLGATLT